MVLGPRFCQAFGGGSKFGSIHHFDRNGGCMKIVVMALMYMAAGNAAADNFTYKGLKLGDSEFEVQTRLPKFNPIQSRPGN